MAISIPLDVYELLEDRLGKEDARKVATTIEVSLDTIEKRAEAVALQKKLEIKDELTKELATKADIEKIDGKINTLKAELEKKIEVVESRLEKKIEVVESRLEKKIEIVKSELEKKIEVEIVNVRAEIANVKAEISNVKADLIKWMFLFWIGQLASLIAILKFFKF